MSLSTNLALCYSSEKKNQPMFTIYYLFSTGLVAVEIQNKSQRFPVKWVLISCFPNSVPWREWAVMSNAHIFLLTTLVSFIRYHVLRATFSGFWVSSLWNALWLTFWSLKTYLIVLKCLPSLKPSNIEDEDLENGSVIPIPSFLKKIKKNSWFTVYFIWF